MRPVRRLPSHLLRVGALCLLVQDVYGVRPPCGVVVLAEGAQERVTCSEELERGVVRTMAEMRRLLATVEPPGPRWVSGKCRACGYHLAEIERSGSRSTEFCVLFWNLLHRLPHEDLRRVPMAAGHRGLRMRLGIGLSGAHIARIGRD